MWTWDQSAGELSRDGQFVSRGYSGRGRGLNNPAMQACVGIGPIPAGRWRLISIAADTHTGPFSILIAPEAATDTHGRSGFRCHGDNARLDRSASHGCIILPRTVRKAIWASGDRALNVVA
jgi:hypothetical protein